jgi:serine phosphatase RsbU (regulator of sigma subunit)/CHASE3 domain sensor protein
MSAGRAVWSLRRRITVLTASAAVLLLLLGGVAAAEAHASAHSAEHQRDVVLPAAVASRSLLASLVDQETGERGYLITGQDQFLQPYTTGQTRVTALFQSLRNHVGRADLKLLDAVVAADQLWLTSTAVPEIADVRAGNRQAAINQEASGSGLMEFNNLRTAVGALSGALESELSQSERTVRRESQLTFVLVLVESAGTILAAVGAQACLRRWVNDPIERLAGDVRVVAQGQLDHTVPATGAAELRGLGADVEAMRRRLRDELEEARQSREALAQAGPVVVKLRSELAPSNSGACDRLAVAGRLAPAEGVLAGDWYDVIALKPDTVAAVMVDISGHGAEAGIFALQIKQLLLPALRLGLTPGDALGWVSEQLGTTEEQYATGLVITLELSSGWCRWANAGHPAALHNRAGTITTLPATGPIIGPLPGVWATEELGIEPGDVLALYTDGITEARDASGREFGMGAVIERLRHASPAGPEEVVEEILSGVRDHTRAALTDDATILVVELRDSPA